MPVRRGRFSGFRYQSGNTANETVVPQNGARAEGNHRLEDRVQSFQRERFLMSITPSASFKSTRPLSCAQFTAAYCHEVIFVRFCKKVSASS